MLRSILSLTVLLLVLAPVGALAGGDLEPAWQALHGLRLTEARELFEQHLEESPADPAALRGLLLTAFFDMDHQTEIEMVAAYVAADPASAYLPALFEYLASTMDEWTESNELTELLSASLTGSDEGALRYMGHRIGSSHLEKTALTWPDDLFEAMGTCPGGWLIGPFDNRTNIAGYRALAIESMPLDTLDQIDGKLGFRCSWAWLPPDRFGAFHPGQVTENETETACQFRAYFSLPDSMEVLLLLGGAFSGRLSVDGRVVHDDPLYRNAVQREGVRLTLSAGLHEIALVVAQVDGNSIFHLNVLDTAYAAIDDLAWLRFADTVAAPPSDTKIVHPIFDPFDAMIADRPSLPDDRYWWATLRIYNGYGDEVIEEFEALFAAGELSLLETWILTRALVRNGEPVRATEYLGHIREAVSTPVTDWFWNAATAESYQAQIDGHIVLDSIYPNRMAIQTMAALKPAFDGDIPGVFARLDELDKSYPTNASISRLKSTYFLRLLNDPESAYREFLNACDKSNDQRAKLLGSTGHLQGLNRWPEAIENTQAAIEVFSHTDALVGALVRSHLQTQSGSEVIPLLDSLIAAYPSNIEWHNLLHAVLSQEGELDRARKVLEAIHRVKPAAVRPYVQIDSLHNSVSYDEIFGSHDVMALWDREPTEPERGLANYWYLLDSRKEIVFDAGVVHSDIHWALVLLDRDAVEQVQEINLGFDNSRWYNKLLTARRLRQGQPPLAGEVEGDYVVFRDLQPGDAIEVHFRTWHSRTGDLWMEYWNTYQVYADCYQRRWEFTVLSEREDIRYSVVAPAEEPTISDAHGFRKMTWTGDNYPAMNVECALAPPAQDLVGKVFVSTVSDWDDIGRWYLAISEAILDNNPRAVALAREITAGLESDMDKLRSLYDYVVQEIPYQVFQFDYDASIPHGPDQVLINRWGDCKDKGHLLIAMLREVGLEAWPVLTMTRSEGTHLPLPQFAFNHLIAACKIGADTVYMDATDVPFPPRYSIIPELSGQPFLLIAPADSGGLRRLDGAAAGDSRWVFTLNLHPRDNGRFDMEYECDYYNLEAGYRRYDLRGVTPAQLREQIETDYSANWGLTVTVDSVNHVAIETSDSSFSENLFGQLDLNVQSFGNTTLVGVPDWAFISKGLVPALVQHGRRGYPVDLRGFVGRFEKTMVFEAPDEYGEPQLGDPVMLDDSLLSFECRSTWNESTRTLRRSHVLEIQDGYCSHEQFEKFARQVMDAFDAPLVFSK